MKFGISRKVGLTALAVAAAMGLSVPLASPALAATCTLNLLQEDPQRDPAGWWVFFNNCSAPVGYFATSFQLWGDDTPFDEQRTGWLPINAFPGTRVDRSVLDEDGIFTGGEDEIYAKVNFFNSSTGDGLTGETNIISHSF